MDAINPSVELTETERIDRLWLARSCNVGRRGIMAQTPQGAKSDRPRGLRRPHGLFSRIDC